MFEGLPQRNIYARSFAWRMFRDAADEDYIVARWAARHGLVHQFFWSAQQAIEKYLKGAILLNGESTKDIGHSLTKGFRKLLPLAGDLLPTLLCPPKYFPTKAHGVWNLFEPLYDFIERFENEGNPATRYRHYSVVYNDIDLHKFDECCFQLRRVNFPLDMPYSSTDMNYRAVLNNYPDYQPHDLKIAKSRFKGGDEDDLLFSTKWKNFSYFEREAREAGFFSTGMSCVNSEISLRLDGDEESRNAIEWLLQNAAFSRQDASELKELIDAAGAQN